MLIFNNNKNEQTSSFLFINSNQKTCTNLISQSTSLLSSNLVDGGLDTCSFYSGPSDSTILGFAETFGDCGAIAYDGGESCGSIAYTGGESCGSIASCDSSSCSYSCCC